MAMRVIQILLAVVLAIQLSACSSSKSNAADMEWSQIGVSAVAPRSLGVNAYLWQAALDTFASLPIVKADPFGGVIISDWYTAPTSNNERMKVTVYIMDRRLLAEGLKVRVFRQVRNNGEWQNATVNFDVERKLEDTILTRARELRLSAVRHP
jgi:hypothetical protein